MLLVAFRAKNISPLHWLVVLGLTGRVANRVCGVAGCDTGEKYFAPTLIGGVGGDGLGCEQGARCLWFAIRAKNISPLHWLVVGQTNRVANRYAMWLVAIRAKNVSPLHWLLVLGLTGPVVNRYAVLLVAIRAKNISPLH